MRPSSVLLVGLLLLSFGCKKAGEPFKPVASTAPPAGWTVAKDAESGLAMNLPPGWRIGMPKGQVAGFATGSGYSDTPTVGDAMGGGGADPGMSMGAMMGDPEAEKAALADLRKEGILLQAVDDQKGTIGEEPTRFYLQEYKDAGNLESLKSQEKELLMNEGAGEAVELPVGKGWMYQNKGTNKIGDMERHVTYLLCDGSTGYALRFVSTNNPTIFDAFHRQVAKSLRKAKK